MQARLAELSATRDQLAALSERAAAQDPADCRGCCSIITGWGMHGRAGLDFPLEGKV